MFEKKTDVSVEDVRALLGEDFEIEEDSRYNILEDNTVTVETGAQETMINPYKGEYLMTSENGWRFTARDLQAVDPRGKIEKLIDEKIRGEPEPEEIFGEPANGIYSAGGGKPYIYVSSDENGSHVQKLHFDPDKGPEENKLLKYIP
jgi:hypothetical protein